MKGSPEAVGRLLHVKPDGYDEKAAYLSKEGYRVISLALKPLGSKDEVNSAQDSRGTCEKDMRFAGFIAFTCRVRKDTAAVLLRLKEGGMSIAMVTGDALLTAIHVAKEVNIIELLSGNGEGDYLEMEQNEELKALIQKKRNLTVKGREAEKGKKNKKFKAILLLEQANGSLFWESYETGSRVKDFDPTQIPSLSKDYDLATTGENLALALESSEVTKSTLGYFKIFSRMTPDAKESVIECLHSVGSLCLMCGDGANDVGALKGADVGVALLTGFGDINADKADEVEDKNWNREKEKDNTTVISMISQQELNQIRSLPITLLKRKIKSMGVELDKYPELRDKEDLVELYQIKVRELAIKKHDQKNALAKKNTAVVQKRQEAQRLNMERQEKLMKRTAELKATGESWATFKAMQEIYKEEMEAAKMKKGFVNGGGIEASAGALAKQFDDMDTGELPMVKLGDASVAAPFTSKMPSIKSCVDIVRQGRCTLVSSIQMHQILALQCLISSYSLSVLYLDGVKYGDTQMTAMGMLGSISFMSVSRSKPLDRLSSVQPLTSIFHPALFVSLLGQFTIHLLTMMIAVHYAKLNMPPDYEVDLDGEFKPGV
jgi:cation-transporting ATPase 13A1